MKEAALRFYDKPWDVDRHRDSRASMGQYSRPLMGHAATTHRHQTSYPRSRAGKKGSYKQEPWKKKLSRLKMATSPTIGTNPSPIGNSTQPKSSMNGRRKLTWKPFWLESLTGYTGTCWTPILLTLTWRKSAVLTRTSTKHIWGTRRLAT